MSIFTWHIWNDIKSFSQGNLPDVNVTFDTVLSEENLLNGRTFVTGRKAQSVKKIEKILGEGFYNMDFYSNRIGVLIEKSDAEIRNYFWVRDVLTALNLDPNMTEVVVPVNVPSVKVLEEFDTKNPKGPTETLVY